MGGGNKRGGKKKGVALVDCVICREPGVISLFVMLITCSHIFHRACVEMLTRDALGRPHCPVCRTSFNLRRDVRSLRFTELHYSEDRDSSESDLGAAAAPPSSTSATSGATSGSAVASTSAAAASNSAVDALAGGLGLLFDSDDDEDSDSPVRAGSLRDESRSIPESLPELEDQLAAICVPRETPN